jgi:hypothetical protein
MEPTELDDILDLGAHIISAHQIYLRCAARAAQRHDARLRQQTKRRLVAPSRDDDQPETTRSRPAPTGRLAG